MAHLFKICQPIVTGICLVSIIFLFDLSVNGQVPVVQSISIFKEQVHVDKVSGNGRVVSMIDSLKRAKASFEKHEIDYVLFDSLFVKNQELTISKGMLLLATIECKDGQILYLRINPISKSIFIDSHKTKYIATPSFQSKWFAIINGLWMNFRIEP